MKTGPRAIAPEIRFWRFVEPVTETGCWLWTGGMMNSGYGCFCPAKGRHVGAHRYSWSLVNGPVPDGLFVCHTCNVKSCVNPAHLYVATPRQNTRDAAMADLLGRKLSNPSVLRLREMRKAGASNSVLMKEFGICRSMLKYVINRTAWAHI